MTRPTLRTCSSGRYWQGAWTDEQGHRRFINGIGATADLTKRQAQKKLDAMNLDGPAEPATVTEWCERYLDTRADLSENTRELINGTCVKLRAEFGSIRVDHITPALAEAWKTRIGDGISDSTVYAHVHRARAIFAAAVMHKLAADNPFDAVRVAKPKAVDEWRYVTMDEFERIIAKCPDVAWCNLFALCRLAGLRSGSRGGEALDLRWDDVVWAKRTIKVTDQKRKQTRLVPMNPRLAEILHAGHTDFGRVCPINHTSVDRKAREIIKAAGLDAYPKPMHSLRKSCEDEWLRKHPIPSVCAWLGNSPKVAMTHYFKRNSEADMAGVTR